MTGNASYCHEGVTHSAPLLHRGESMSSGPRTWFCHAPVRRVAMSGIGIHSKGEAKILLEIRLEPSKRSLVNQPQFRWKAITSRGSLSSGRRFSIGPASTAGPKEERHAKRQLGTEDTSEHSGRLGVQMASRDLMALSAIVALLWVPRTTLERNRPLVGLSQPSNLKSTSMTFDSGITALQYSTCSSTSYSGN